MGHGLEREERAACGGLCLCYVYGQPHLAADQQMHLDVCLRDCHLCMHTRNICALPSWPGSMNVEHERGPQFKHPSATFGNCFLRPRETISAAYAFAPCGAVHTH